MDCQIRPWKLDDAEELASMLNNENIQKNLRDGLPFPYTVRDALVFIHTMLNADPSTVFSFAITADDKLVGCVGAFRKENIHKRTAEMGYYIAEPFWGKGLATSAVAKLLQYISEHTDIIRIFAEPFSYNIPSCRVLEKSGFMYEGTLRSNAVKNGEILDMKMYSYVMTCPDR